MPTLLAPNNLHIFKGPKLIIMLLLLILIMTYGNRSGIAEEATADMEETSVKPPTD
jgi:hypothetical protein